jgi:hypothetical protein
VPWPRLRGHVLRHFSCSRKREHGTQHVFQQMAPNMFFNRPLAEVVDLLPYIVVYRLIHFSKYFPNASLPDYCCKYLELRRGLANYAFV